MATTTTEKPWWSSDPVKAWIAPLEALEALDLVTIAYAVGVIALMLTRGIEHASFWPVIALHTLLLVCAFGLARWDAGSQRARWPRFAHLTYPIWLLPLVHYQSGLINLLIFPDYFDPLLAQLDLRLFGAELYRHWAPLMDSRLVDEVMNLSYFAFYPLIALAGLGTWFKRRAQMPEFVFVFTLAMYSMLFFFIIFPAQGPTAHREGMLMVERGLFGPLIEQLVVSADSAGGAFPSSHCGGTFVLAYYILRLWGRRAVAPLALVCATLWMSTVYLSFHYSVDVLVGLTYGALMSYVGPTLFRNLQASCARGDGQEASLRLQTQ